MLYNLLKLLTRLTLSAYFKRIKVDGLENIPNEGPIIFVANHPSAFMDPMVVASSIKHSVHFIAAGEYVGKGLKGYAFKNWLHMVPVFRPSNRPEDAHKNTEMFSYCYSHLKAKGCLLIFPEGVSETDRRLKPLKTGVIRIAQGAEKIAGTNPIPIIPVGLNYSNPHEFRSDLYIKISEPFYSNSYFAGFSQTDKDQTVQATKALEEKMRENLLHTFDEETDDFFTQLDLVYTRDLKAAFGIDYYDQEREFKLRKELINAVRFFKKADLASYNHARNRLKHYTEELKKNGLSDKDIAELSRQINYKKVLSFVLGFPIFVVGICVNILPYSFVNFIHRKINIASTFKGSISLALGLGVFIFWYLLLTVILGTSFLGWFGLFLPIVFYVTGMYTLVYLSAIRYSLSRRYLRFFFKRQSTIILDLAGQRREIIHYLEICKQRYNQEAI
jgi:glycerol-3-phosphate O-acyltransferase/dihydroxyacetone phosphate acyltransferase